MKSSTYLLRLDPQKKALWESKAKEEEISLAKWIESKCDAEPQARMNEEFLSLCPMSAEMDVPVTKEMLKEMAKEAREQHNRGEATPLHQEAECDLRPFERKPVGKIAKMLKEKG